MVYTIGLIGGIACGKSTALKFFKQHGIECTSADDFAKSLIQKGSPCYHQLVKYLGVDYLNEDGTFNRHRLRERLLSDKDFKSHLEGLLHPLIQDEMTAWQRQVKSPYCVMEIPLLQDKTSYHLDRVLCIQSAEEVQKDRLTQRQLKDSEIAGLLAIQVPLAKRMQLSDDIILNDCTLEQFHEKLEQLHHQYLKLSLAKVQKTS